ncbi:MULTISPECIES: hypothetical protein [unclassified Acidiphilium]|uniref:hypothetical protein n=1 Tax=unclassified Acidiphilium TaxID=2617493 RepID=UPI000BD814DA|nr:MULTISPECIES: hypothetical protein [unclassified Acidiphilium]OZB22914.1 MAG: hypothetical protein B7X49_16555 [Acidiphilium sp. 34-64-41]
MEHQGMFAIRVSLTGFALAMLISASGRAALPAQPIPRAVYAGVQLFRKYDQSGGMSQVVQAVNGCYRVMATSPGLTLGKIECLGEDSAAYEMSIAMTRLHGFPPLPYYTQTEFFGRTGTVLRNAGINPAAERNHLMSSILLMSGQDYHQMAGQGDH